MCTMFWRHRVYGILLPLLLYYLPSCLASFSERNSVIISELYVPAVAKAGENVTLICKFELLGRSHKLYTVNWWRGKDQFFSYKENSYHHKNAYNFEGINVNVQMSTQNMVVLDKITEDTSGEFKCEVMGESPAFKTAVETKYMRVIVPPRTIEINHGMGPDPNYQYQPGDDIQLNCTVHDVKPRPLIIWKVNNREVQKEHSYRYPDYENHRGRVTSTSKLQFRAPLFFIERQAKVECVALVEGLEFVEEKIINLDPSAAFHLYSSCGWQWSMTWQVISLLLFIAL